MSIAHSHMPCHSPPSSAVETVETTLWTIQFHMWKRKRERNVNKYDESRSNALTVDIDIRCDHIDQIGKLIRIILYEIYHHIECGSISFRYHFRWRVDVMSLRTHPRAGDDEQKYFFSILSSLEHELPQNTIILRLHYAYSCRSAALWKKGEGRCDTHIHGERNETTEDIQHLWWWQRWLNDTRNKPDSCSNCYSCVTEHELPRTELMSRPPSKKNEITKRRWNVGCRRETITRLSVGVRRPNLNRTFFFLIPTLTPPHPSTLSPR